MSLTGAALELAAPAGREKVHLLRRRSRGRGGRLQGWAAGSVLATAGPVPYRHLGGKCRRASVQSSTGCVNDSGMSLRGLFGHMILAQSSAQLAGAGYDHFHAFFSDMRFRCLSPLSALAAGVATRRGCPVVDHVLSRMPPFAKFRAVDLCCVGDRMPRAAWQVHGDLRLLRLGPRMAAFIGTGCHFRKMRVRKAELRPHVA